MSTKHAFRFRFCVPQHACMIDSLEQFHLLLFEERSGLCGICWNSSARDWSYQHLPNIAKRHGVCWSVTSRSCAGESASENGVGSSGSADWQTSKVLGPGFKWTSPHRSRIAQKTIAGSRFVDTGIVCRCRSRCTHRARPSSRTYILYNIMYWLHESNGRPTVDFPGEFASGAARLRAEHQPPHICVPNRKNRYSASMVRRENLLV